MIRARTAVLLLLIACSMPAFAEEDLTGDHERGRAARAEVGPESRSSHPGQSSGAVKKEGYDIEQQPKTQ